MGGCCCKPCCCCCCCCWGEFIGVDWKGTCDDVDPKPRWTVVGWPRLGSWNEIRGCWNFLRELSKKVRYVSWKFLYRMFEFCWYQIISPLSRNYLKSSVVNYFSLIKVFDPATRNESKMQTQVSAMRHDKYCLICQAFDIYRGYVLEEKLVSHHQAVNINCWLYLSLSRLFLTLYLIW